MQWWPLQDLWGPLAHQLGTLFQGLRPGALKSTSLQKPERCWGWGRLTLVVAVSSLSLRTLPHSFSAQNPKMATYQVVELRILTNWGHPEYTCIYRFRVHGEPAH